MFFTAFSVTIETAKKKIRTGLVHRLPKSLIPLVKSKALRSFAIATKFLETYLKIAAEAFDKTKEDHKKTR